MTVPDWERHWGPPSPTFSLSLALALPACFCACRLLVPLELYVLAAACFPFASCLPLVLLEPYWLVYCFSCRCCLRQLLLTPLHLLRPLHCVPHRVLHRSGPLHAGGLHGAGDEAGGISALMRHSAGPCPPLGLRSARKPDGYAVPVTRPMRGARETGLAAVWEARCRSYAFSALGERGQGPHCQEGLPADARLRRLC